MIRLLLNFVVLALALGFTETAIGSEVNGADDARSRALALFNQGDSTEALTVLDSLLVNDLSDLTVAYLAARAEELTGREDRARCRFLELEGLATGREEAILSQARRRMLERAQADQQISLGAAWMTSPDEVRAIAGGIVLFPLENLGDTTEAPYYGLAWSYLLQEAMRGSGLCPVSMPSMLLVTDILTRGQAIRAHADLSRRPINTVGGLRARLSILPGPDGSVYLQDREGDWDDDLRTAIRRFQQDQQLPASGEADLSTQSALQRVIENWLAQPPLPLAPNLLPRAMELLGASLSLRGTYRIDQDEVWVQVTLLDSRGQGLLAEPIVLHFPHDRTTASAFAAVEQLIGVAGGDLAPTAKVAPTISLRGLDQATAALLLLDRGVSRLAEQRWVTMSEEALSWSLLRGARDFTEFLPAQQNRMERELIEGWAGQVRIDPSLGFDFLMSELAGGKARTAGPLKVLGELGTVRIRGERR